MSHLSYNTLRSLATRAFEHGGDYFHLSLISHLISPFIFLL